MFKRQICRHLGALAAMGATAVVIVGCGSSSSASSSGAAASSSTTSAAAPKSGPIKVGLELTGPDNDNGYYQEVATGLKAAGAKQNAKVTITQNVGFNPADIVTAIKNLALQGNQLIIADGASGDGAYVVAKQFPKIQFVIHTAPPPHPLRNLHGFIPEQGVTSYVLGQLASHLTKSGKVGFLGGAQDVPTGQSGAGYVAGVKSVSPPPTVQKTIVGTYSDPGKGKSAAAAQIANGVDVIYAYLDAGFYGVTQAVTESHKRVMLLSGTVLRCSLSPLVVGSALADNSILIGQMLSDFRAGTLPVGTKFYGLENPAIQRVALCPAYNTAANRKIVADATQAIVNGKIKLASAITGR